MKTLHLTILLPNESDLVSTFLNNALDDCGIPFSIFDVKIKHFEKGLVSVALVFDKTVESVYPIMSFIFSLTKYCFVTRSSDDEV